MKEIAKAINAFILLNYRYIILKTGKLTQQYANI